MKKKVRLQINALAKKIIVDGNELNTRSLKGLVLKLYEKITILEYLESSNESDLESLDRDAIDSKTYREENWFQDPKPVPQSQYEDELAEPLMEKIKDIVAQMPHEAQRVDEILENILPNKETEKNELEEFAKDYQEMPIFEKKESEDKKEIEHILESKNSSSEKPKSLNDKLNQGLSIGLNDRLAFIKQLFDNNADDYTRVLSQINTLSNFKEVANFIEENVKPEYNNWTDKDEFSERFMIILEKRFS